MTPSQQKQAAKAFAKDWAGRGYEKGESQSFWLALLRDVLGVAQPEKIITFEDQVKIDHTSFIDGIIPSTHVLIEQKSLGKDLKAPIKQSDGTLLSPFQQAKRYSAELPYSQRPRWIVCCNFEQFHIYDMERPHGEPESIMLTDLENEAHRLQFLVADGNERIQQELKVSREAAALIGKLHDALEKQYMDPSSKEAQRWLNVLCVRLVFLMYAEDTDVLGKRDRFCNYLESFKPENAREAIRDLFKMLDTPDAERDPYDSEKLRAFPYVNGGLFSDQSVQIPRFTPEIYDILVKEACPYDWAGISPTIFGAMFESTLNPDTRRSGGMHYTSVENIHKVIDPLFLNELRAEFEHIKAIPNEKKRFTALRELQTKLSRLVFFDPACGSGNFLTETYISLRRLENEILKELQKGQMVMGFGEEWTPIMVSISQFYGIEVNDFAVSVARTAMWIAEAQMLEETQSIIHVDLNFLPLKANPNIVEADALRIDWAQVVDPTKLTYIIGNPPFVGSRMMDEIQRESMQIVFGSKWQNLGTLDFVCGWYKKAAEMINGTPIQAAFVSTNSITQGEQVVNLWKPLVESTGIHLDFAHSTFVWDSEASDKAHVHVVILGFSSRPTTGIKLYKNGIATHCSHLNFYLADALDVFVDRRSKSLCGMPGMNFGNMPRDGGFLNFKEEERIEFLKKEPELEPWIYLYIGAEEFINNKKRYCFWLEGITPGQIRKSSILSERIEGVRKFREASKAKSTQNFAQTSWLFAQRTQPIGKPYILVPCVSSERRKYVPMGFVSGDVIASNLVQIIPNAALYHFGILTSNIHMAWMRAVGGRLKSDYRYSKDIVYNNFPWPSPTPEQQAKIEATAQAILDARALYPDSSLADLYDETTMPPQLRKAHQANDRAVMEAYGLPIKTTTESSCVARLFELYATLTDSHE